MAYGPSSRPSMLVSVEARDVPALCPLVQERDKVSHEGELPLAAFTPA